MNGRIDWARSRRRIFVQDRSIVFIFVLRFSLFDLYDSLRLRRWEREGDIEKFASYQKNPVDCRVNSDSFSIFPRDRRVDTAGRKESDKKNSVKWNSFRGRGVFTTLEAEADGITLAKDNCSVEWNNLVTDVPVKNEEAARGPLPIILSSFPRFFFNDVLRRRRPHFSVRKGRPP